ncbi:MAG: PVC-type heme-binding CxxCH protein [Bacteroidota bacterium]
MTRSISWETVEDRRDFLHSFFSPDSSEENSWLPDLNGDSIHDWQDLKVQKEKIYRIEDTDGDGFADQTQLFYEGFHDEITDVAGALLPYGEDVYVGVAPDLWKLTDTDQDGWADAKESLSHGYAVHVGFSGHGMSGLTYGPDGRIYWSIGDIGFSIEDGQGNKQHYPNQGGIFRANPDGSDLEVFAVGLRNTHEFAFDKYGNLISVDNDGDHPGEKERIVYVVEGSDAGWRANWQYGKYTDPNNNAYKVWMDESYFKERWEDQAAHLVPPVLNYHSGPTSILYNPGTALGSKWANRFIMGEFTGTPARSHVYAFDLQPKGAGFEFKGEEMMVGGILATGMDFGPDGSLYMADWIDGWGTKDYGRIWKLDVPADSVANIRRETQKLIQTDFSKRPVPDFVNWLSHEDMRIRLKAQFELATRVDRGETGFLTALSHKDHQLSRIHAVWGLGQMIRQDEYRGEKLLPWLEDEDPEIRAQVAKTIGDVRVSGADPALIKLLADESARVQFFAAEALGRLKTPDAVQPLLLMLEANEDEDVYLRHAGALALSRIGQADLLLALSESPSRALRIAAVVTLRRMRHAGVAKFLNDADEFVATNAARAIHDDWSIPGALPELARQLDAPRFNNEPYLRRVINANFRLGETEHLERLSNFVNQTKAPAAMRAEALACLSTWPKPSVLDRVVGRNRNLQPRETGPVLAEVQRHLGNWLAAEQAEVLIASTDLMARLEISDAADQLMALLRSHPNTDVRLGALLSIILPKVLFILM